VEHYISRVADRLAGAVYQLSVDHLQACESPIETGLGVGLVSMHLLNKHFRFAAMPSASIETEWSAIIYIQPPAGDYRLDFAIHLTAQSGGRSLNQWFAIECDGHDFHEKTKEQAQRDKARDRYLTAEGFKILRFTGAEIYADVNKCITEIYFAVTRAYSRWAEQG